MASWPRTLLPFEVTSLEMPGPLISKAQSGRVNIRSTQQVGRSWTERYLVNVRSVDGRALLAAVSDYWRNGTIFTIDHRDHLTPLGTGGGSPLINQPTQLVTNPENFGAWTNASTPIVTAGQADPFGGAAAYRIEDDNAAAPEGKTQIVTFTGDGTKAISIFLKQGLTPPAGGNIIILLDITAGNVERMRATVTWAAGVPSVVMSAGGVQLANPEPWGNGWYRFYWQAVGIVAANFNQFLMLAASTAGTGDGYFFGANAWNTATPAGYIGPSHLTATGSRIYLDGATASVSNWLRAGDILSVGGLAPIYEVTANVNSEAGGYASIPVNPTIYTGGAPADNAVVTITGVTMNACLIEPPSFPTTSGSSNDFGELVCRFSESL